jgi:hypothetical protein
MRKSVISSLALLAASALALPVFAEPISKTVTFAEPVTVNGTQVKPGDYKVVVDGNKVTIEKRHNVIVQTDARVEQRNAKYPTTSVVHDANGAVREIDLGGGNQAIVFGAGAGASGTQK